jgi:histone-lysine N-methyltransferase SETD7
VGRVDTKGELTGMRVAYIYPDFKTAFVGTFEAGVLESVQVAFLKSVVDDRGIKIPIFTEATGPMYTREVSDYEHVTSEPLLPDPYESHTIEVKVSKVSVDYR